MVHIPTDRGEVSIARLAPAETARYNASGVTTRNSPSAPPIGIPDPPQPCMLTTEWEGFAVYSSGAN